MDIPDWGLGTAADDSPGMHLSRCKCRSEGIIISPLPVRLAMHWYRGRSVICTGMAGADCPICTGQPPRWFIYQGVRLADENRRLGPAELYELPAAADSRAIENVQCVHRAVLGFVASRNNAKAPIHLAYRILSREATPQLSKGEILKNLCRVLGMPQFDSFASNSNPAEAWLEACAKRLASDAFYSKWRG